MVLLRDTSIPKLEASVTIMKEKAAETDTVSFAIGISLEEDSTHIYEAMKAADVNMYEDKKKFYEENPELKRR